MKSKSGKSGRMPSKAKTRKNPIRNKTLISTEEINLENLFEQMKTDILDEIQRVAKEKMEEHQTKIINFINDNKPNDIIQAPIEAGTEVKKPSKYKIKKTNKKGKLNNTFDQILVNQELDEVNEINPPPSEKITTKRKRTTTKKKKTKKKANKNEPIAQVGEKTEKNDISSNDISKLSGTVVKSSKIDKKGNGKVSSDKELTGKKRKRNSEKFVFLFNSEPNPENVDVEVEKKVEKKPKKTKGKRKAKSSRKAK